MAHVPKQKRQKLDYKSQKMIFVGYESAGYRCINKNTRKITISRDVKFHETARSSTDLVRANQENEISKIWQDNIDQAANSPMM